MDPLEILKAVDDFYRSAWDKLIIYTGILVAVVGVIIPILFTWLQNRTQRIREEVIKKELENAFDAKLKEIEEKLTGSIEENMGKKSAEIEKKIENKVEMVEAYAIHIQGDNRFNQKLFKLSLKDYFIAGKIYLNGKDHLHLGRVNTGIKEAIQSITKEELEALQSESSQPSTYISLLEEKNENGILTDFITVLKHVINSKLKSGD